MNVPEAKREWRRFTGRPSALRRWLKSDNARKQRRAARVALKNGEDPQPWRGVDAYVVS